MFLFHKKHQHHLKWLIPLFAIFFIVIASPISAYFFFEKKYQNKIYPNIFLGDINLGNLSRDNVLTIITQKIDQVNQNGIIFNYKTNSALLYPFAQSTEDDSVYQIIYFDIEKTLNNAINYGRDEKFYNNILKKIAALIHGYQITMSYTLHEPEIEKFLNTNFKKLEIPAKNATLSYQENKKTGKTTFKIQKEANGQIINITQAKKDLRDRLDHLYTTPIELITETDYPEIRKDNILNIDAMSQKFYNKIPITLKYKLKKWTLTKENILPWLQLKINHDSENKNIFIGLDTEKIKKYLEKNIAPQVNKESIDPKFNIKNGKVSEFQAGQEGIILDIEATTKKIEFFLNNEEINQELEVITEIKKPLSASEIENLGIKELLGTGHSKFTGSPKNRISNIKTGANAVNGSIIKPGEEFSLLSVLGKIDSSSGYLPELVIKEGKTVPEYGGGLCQVGTTAFRGTIKSGLPVTMRRNHSYRVSYYEPAGTDATIYDPWPDYKFKNDTNNHILILSRIEGYNLYFDFWGTKDGRTATSTYPVIYNIVKPAPTKIIESTSLKPGEKKCTEHAHNGADAYFDYKITYPPTGTSTTPIIKKTRFYSHYVPWREICLIGIDPNKKASSSNSIIKQPDLIQESTSTDQDTEKILKQ